MLNRTQLAVSNINASLKRPPCTKIRNAADALEVGRRWPCPDILRHSQGWDPKMNLGLTGPVREGLKWHLMSPNTSDDTDIRGHSNYNSGFGNAGTGGRGERVGRRQSAVVFLNFLWQKVMREM